MNEISERIYAISGGNSGALRVCMDMHKLFADGLDLLESSGLRKSNIWIAFKDFGDQTCETLHANLKRPGFVDKVKTSPDWENC
jgi:hypothetical protein